MGCSVSFLLVRRLLDSCALAHRPTRRTSRSLCCAATGHVLGTPLPTAPSWPRWPGCSAGKAGVPSWPRRPPCCAGTESSSPAPGRPRVAAGLHPMRSRTRSSPSSCAWPGRTGAEVIYGPSASRQVGRERLGHECAQRAASSPPQARAPAIGAVVVRVLASAGGGQSRDLGTYSGDFRLKGEISGGPAPFSQLGRATMGQLSWVPVPGGNDPGAYGPLWPGRSRRACGTHPRCGGRPCGVHS